MCGKAPKAQPVTPMLRRSEVPDLLLYSGLKLARKLLHSQPSMSERLCQTSQFGINAESICTSCLLCETLFPLQYTWRLVLFTLRRLATACHVNLSPSKHACGSRRAWVLPPGKRRLNFVRWPNRLEASHSPAEHAALAASAQRAAAVLARKSSGGTATIQARSPPAKRCCSPVRRA